MRRTRTARTRAKPFIPEHFEQGGSGDAKDPLFVPLYNQEANNSADNFTDVNFLADMQLNPSMHIYSVQDTVSKASRIAFQLSATILFYVMYYNLSTGVVLPSLLLKVCWSTSIVGHTIFQLYRHWPIPINLLGFQILFPKDRLRVTLVYMIFSYALAPILRTLTATISTDTIHASSVVLICLHLLTNDYGVSGFFVSKTISMNAAVIGAICLASRLPTDTHSLSLLTLAVQTFVLFPIFSNILWDSSVSLIILVLAVAYACATISSNIFLAYVVVVMFVTAVLPLFFVVCQKFKYNLYGPWDEAVVSSLSERRSNS